MKKELNSIMLNKKIKLKFEEAIKLGKSRKYEEASELLLNITKETSDFPEAYLYLGRSYHSLNRMHDAIHVLRHYITLAPNSSTGNFFLGRSLLSSGFSKNSIFYLKKAVLSHPESMHANGFLGIAYLKSGRSDVALNYLSKAVESSNIDTGIYKIYLGTLFLRAVNNFKSGNIELSSQMFIFLIENNFKSILPYIYLGMIERQNNNYNKALEYYEKALEFSPNDKLLLYRRAVLLHKVGNTNIAVEELKKLDIEPDIDENIYLAYQFFNQKKFNKALYYGNLALHNDNKSIELHMFLGEVNRELNILNVAENHYRKAIKLDRTIIEGRYGLSLILWLNKDYESMMQELKKINISDPNNSISSYYTALCMSKLDYNTEDTIPVIQNEIRNNKPDCYLFTALGQEYLKADLDDLAEKWFLKAIKINNNFVEAYLYLIDFYKRADNKIKLMDSYKNYLDLSFDLNRNIEYAILLYKENNFSETIVEINKFLQSVPNNIKLLRMLANSYRFTKNWVNAIFIYKQILLKNPENVIVLQSLVYCLDHSGRRNEAIKLINQALEYIKTPTINLLLIKGVLCFKNKEYDTALKVFRKTLNEKSDDWRIYHNIAMIYKAKGVDDFAEQFFSRAMEYKNK